MTSHPCLAIDFGNAFTNVAVWTGAPGRSVQRALRDLPFERGLNACIPTAAVKSGSGELARWHFGSEIRDVPFNRPDCRLFLDWKREP